MHSNKVVLDRESFKALSSGTRISILKALDGKRQTVTQLSKELEISKPALLKHLEALIVAKLVKKEGKERKWIYYDLAFKGKNLLHPERAAVTVLLSAAFASLAGAIAGFLRFLFNPISSGQLSGEGRYYAPGGDLGLSQSEGAGAQYYPGYPGENVTFIQSAASDYSMLYVGITLIVLFLGLLVLAIQIKKWYAKRAKI